MKIYAPVKNANGVYASVRFVNGVGETDNPVLIRWFKEHGYVIESSHVTEPPLKAVEIEQTIQNVVEDSDPQFEDMTPNELREWMKQNGLGLEIKNIKNKEKLLAIIKNSKGE